MGIGRLRVTRGKLLCSRPPNRTLESAGHSPTLMRTAKVKSTASRVGFHFLRIDVVRGGGRPTDAIASFFVSALIRWALPRINAPCYNQVDGVVLDG